MPARERLHWFREAQAARARQLLDMTQAAGFPYMSQDGRSSLVTSALSQARGYSSEQADAAIQEEEEIRRDRAALKAEFS